jgi:NAD(P)-dependent dehydrogenase (short-subunit alcohol dehydrogenase family)
LSTRSETRLMTDLAGKVAIVTGGSRGIGAGTAFVLAKAGAAVTLVPLHRRIDGLIVTGTQGR